MKVIDVRRQQLTCWLCKETTEAVYALLPEKVAVCSAHLPDAMAVARLQVYREQVAR